MDVTLDIDGVELPGTLQMPAEASGVVVFAHGSGSSHRSPRNRAVASRLNEAGFATLLFDLLTAEEETDRGNVFDIGLLAERLRAATSWMRAQPAMGNLPVAYFGASTGAAAALRAAADEDVFAVVSRGGRPDLTGERIRDVTAPVLLLVGERDEPVIGMNKEAEQQLSAPTELRIVASATHLFEEPGALETVADMAAEFLTRQASGVSG